MCSFDSDLLGEGVVGKGERKGRGRCLCFAGFVRFSFFTTLAWWGSAGVELVVKVRT